MRGTRVTLLVARALLPVLGVLAAIGLGSMSPAAITSALLASALVGVLVIAVAAAGAAVDPVALVRAGPNFAVVPRALPRDSDPDADGHVRARAPGLATA